MTYQEFVDKYNNKGIDFDGAYGFQCMDLAHQYANEVCGHDFAPAPAAKDVWNQDPSGYDKIANTPEGVPTKGDIMIWGVGVGPYGHIAVFDHGDTNTFTSFDQNWPLNSLCHLQNHNYNGVLGWFHPQNSAIIPQPITQEITDQTKLETKSDGTIEWQVVKSLLEDRKTSIVSKDQHIDDLTKTNNQQVQLLEDLRKQLADCQNKATSPSTPQKTPSSPLGKYLYTLALKLG